VAVTLKFLFALLAEMAGPEKIMRKCMARRAAFCYLMRRLTLWQKSGVHDTG
jgi:hypothetical protein